MKKRTLFWVGIMAAVVSGCGQNSGGKEQTSEIVGNSTKPIEYLSQKIENVDYIDEIMNDYMEKNPGINLVQTTTTGSVSISSRVAANDIPDMMNTFANANYRVMAEEGIFKDLSGKDFLNKVPQEYIDLFTLEDGTVW